MKRTILGTLLILPLLLAASGYGQSSGFRSTTPIASVAWLEEPDNQEGPDYAVYKKGYDLVLDEKWDAAKKQFTELQDKYPKSDYIDDARYWSAYALMHTDLKKALSSYKEFVKKYPKSSYYDDAVADMANIEAQMELMAVAKSEFNDQKRGTGVFAPHATVAPEVYTLDSKMRSINRNLRRLNRRVRGVHLYTPAPYLIEEKRLDAKTRLKLDALQAIGANTEDDKAFNTLKEVALDTKQPIALRREALNLLSDFTSHDVDAVYMAIVQKDTSEEMQVIAIDNIGQSGKDKDKTVQTLEQLYASLPARHEDQRATALYRIADVGNDRAVDFLAKVARTDSDYDLRSDAVYYLGNIGGEKARAVLYDILKSE